MASRLENWYLGAPVTDPYTAPELAQQVLAGDVYGDPRFPDGHSISTSPIAKVEGRTVTTRSGTVYELGEVSEDYFNYCKDFGTKYDLKSDSPLGEYGG